MRSLRSLLGSFYTAYREPDRHVAVVDARVATVEAQVVPVVATGGITSQ